ncbi:MAG: TauD/TfdA family dioxygenase [Alphaproteobacteria bacterium]|nr:TauD/TfdA family dioxygenase [Alphaproteobacteria bacterium]
MSNGALEVKPISGALGAEVSGLDLSQDLDPGLVDQLKDAFHEHLVLFFRDQDISSARFLTFTGLFGDVMPYPMVQGLDDYPDIVPVLKLAHETKNFGGIWHTDTSYLEYPPMASILIARELPPIGGDTIWSNMYLAYETLSDGMKRMLDGMTAVNSSAKGAAARSRDDRRKTAAKNDFGETPEAVHPVVRIHPETGRKALYVNFGHTTRFSNMTEAESAPILNYLFEHQTRPEFTCRLTWRPATIAFWDNRATQHFPLNDYHGHKRLLHRITLAGDRPV